MICATKREPIESCDGIYSEASAKGLKEKEMILKGLKVK